MVTESAFQSLFCSFKSTRRDGPFLKTGGNNTASGNALVRNKHSIVSDAFKLYSDEAAHITPKRIDSRTYIESVISNVEGG